jgi:hypothetical protein
VSCQLNSCMTTGAYTALHQQKNLGQAAAAAAAAAEPPQQCVVFNQLFELELEHTDIDSLTNRGIGHSPFFRLELSRRCLHDDTVVLGAVCLALQWLLTSCQTTVQPYLAC